MKAEEQEYQAQKLDQEVLDIQADYEELEKLLVAYAQPMQEVEKVIRLAEQEEIKAQFEK